MMMGPPPQAICERRSTRDPGSLSDGPGLAVSGALPRTAPERVAGKGHEPTTVPDRVPTRSNDAGSRRTVLLGLTWANNSPGPGQTQRMSLRI